jgi:hypothetical protein
MAAIALLADELRQRLYRFVASQPCLQLRVGLAVAAANPSRRAKRAGQRLSSKRSSMGRFWQCQSLAATDLQRS